MVHEGSIDIATGYSSTSKVWNNTSIEWDKLVEKLSSVTRTNETYAEFIKAPKTEQNTIKDIGGYVGGKLLNGRRHAANVIHRQLISLDIDFAHETLWWNFIAIYNCAAVLHSTHKHNKAQQRVRLVIPLSRPVDVYEYEAVARKVAGDLDINIFDATTFQVHRLMYWPSASIDGDWLFEKQDGEWLNVDNVLATYNDWTDSTEWPRTETQEDNILRDIKKQEAPEDKTGIVGIFCRAYGIAEAIETFLPETYLKTTDDRYSYAEGTTAGGLVIYDNTFAYSHHSTDPCMGRLCNAFDLVRIHKFGHLDKSNPKANASFKAMELFASKDDAVKIELATESFSNAKDDFAGNFDKLDISWAKALEVNTKGGYESTATNISIIIKNDELIKDNFKLNTLSNKRYLTRSVPWRPINGLTQFRDVDYSGLRIYLETIYSIVGISKIDDALAVEFEANAFHPIRDYLSTLTWDGVPRVDTLLIDYFDAEDNVYTRAAIKKALIGAVARVFNPGIKFDLVLTLVGPQGTGKSTFIKKLGQEWFSDTFTTVHGKEAYEQVQGAWIIEIAELSGLRKAEVETIKQYISKCEDTFRPAYGRTVETYPRQCIFMGTTNDDTFLRDHSGNRRFMPISLGSNKPKFDIFTQFTKDIIDNIWAETFDMYLNGETLFLNKEEEEISVQQQEIHLEVDDRQGVVSEYLNLLVPEDWYTYDLNKRLNWLDDPIHAKGTVLRHKVCAAEIWSECLRKDKADLTLYSTREIHVIMRGLKSWKRRLSPMTFPIYGRQRYYKLTTEELA